MRERAMLGDAGASLLAAGGGLGIALALPALGRLIGLARLGIITLYGEIRSISAIVARIPVPRELDSWGRPS